MLPPERTYINIHRNQNYSNSEGISIPENSFQWCVEQFNKSHTFEESKRHPYIISLACYCNKKGIDKETTLNGCLHFIQPDFKEKEINDIVKHIYTTQKDSHGKLPFKKRNPPKKRNVKKIKKQPIIEAKIHPNPKTETTENKEPKMISPIETNPKFLSDEEDIKPIQKEPSNQWDIAEFEAFYANVILPSTPVQLSVCERIDDVNLFVESHLEYVRANNGKRIFLPYLERLQDLKELLSNH